MTSSIIDSTYADEVSTYVRGQSKDSDALRTMLLSEENIHKTYEVLIGLKRDVERQLSSQKSKNIQVKSSLIQDKENGLPKWIEHQKEYADWKVKVVRFLSAIEDALSEVRQAKRALNDGRVSPARRVHKLESAIERHRRNITEDEGSEVDWDLWRVLSSSELVVDA